MRVEHSNILQDYKNPSKILMTINFGDASYEIKILMAEK